MRRLSDDERARLQARIAGLERLYPGGQRAPGAVAALRDDALRQLAEDETLRRGRRERRAANRRDRLGAIEAPNRRVEVGRRPSIDPAHLD